MDDDNSGDRESEGSPVDQESSDEEDSSRQPNQEESDQGMQALIYQHKRDIRNLRRNNLIHLAFGRPIRSIPPEAFSGCNNLQQVSFRDGLQIIESNSFKACSSLKTISFPSTLLQIEDRAFCNSGLESVEFNEGLQAIGYAAFAWCTSLKTITLSSSLKMVGSCAFLNCYDLAVVDFGMGVQEIGPCAFRRCISLTVIHLPPSLEIIRKRAFSVCKRLLSVGFPLSGMRRIEEFAFQDCNVLTNVVIPPSPTEIAETTFRRCGRLEEVFYPDLANYPLNAFYHGIKKRYARLPIHEFCYMQPYMPTSAALEKLISTLGSEADAIERTDAAGMTAFHTLALSSRPEMQLFQTLQAYSPRWQMELPDRWGFRPIQYMCSNSSIPKSERQRLVDYLAEATVMHRAHKLRLPKWRLTVISKAREILLVEETMTLEESQEIVQIYEVLERYELLETLSLLELRLWQWKLKSQEGIDSKSHDVRPKRIKLDERELARVNCGADIVIGNVLPYLKAGS